MSVTLCSRTTNALTATNVHLTMGTNESDGAGYLVWMVTIHPNSNTRNASMYDSHASRLKTMSAVVSYAESHSASVTMRHTEAMMMNSTTKKSVFFQGNRNRPKQPNTNTTVPRPAPGTTTP